jgi:hypothetical protein
MAPPLKVDPERLKVIARQMGTIADDIDRVEHAVDSCAPGGDDVLGESGVAAAYRQFHDLWTAELHTTTGATRQLADGLRRSADGYFGSDDYARHRFA